VGIAGKKKKKIREGEERKKRGKEKKISPFIRFGKKKGKDQKSGRRPGIEKKRKARDNGTGRGKR